MTNMVAPPSNVLTSPQVLILPTGSWGRADLNNMNNMNNMNNLNNLNNMRFSPKILAGGHLKRKSPGSLRGSSTSHS